MPPRKAQEFRNSRARGAASPAGTTWWRISKTSRQYSGGPGWRLVTVGRMAEVIGRRHGRRRHPNARRGVPPYVVVNVVLVIGLAVAVFALTR